MAVDQHRLGEIMSAASADDPDAKLQDLEREVDLIKTSIKRLLMDLRQRMNEPENSFTHVSSTGQSSMGGIDTQAAMDKQSALEAREAALDAREYSLEVLKSLPETEPQKENPADKTDPVLLPGINANPVPEYGFPVPGIGGSGPSDRSLLPSQTPDEILPFLKAYNLFCWTQLSVKKFGHNRLGILVESYCIMGYIRKKTADEIQQISRLMPENLGEVHEIGPDEFVFEIYTLNRILTPGDTSLDRDMIEVLMEQRQHGRPEAKTSGYQNSIPESAPEQNKAGSPAYGKKDLEWMNLRV